MVLIHKRYRQDETGQLIEVESRDYADKVWELSKAPYQVVIQAAELSNGDIVYMAYHPELTGCMTQGDNPEQALLMLQDARLMMLEHLLEHNLPIPKPALDKPIKWDSERA